MSCIKSRQRLWKFHHLIISVPDHDRFRKALNSTGEIVRSMFLCHVNAWAVQLWSVWKGKDKGKGQTLSVVLPGFGTLGFEFFCYSSLVFTILVYIGSSWFIFQSCCLSLLFLTLLLSACPLVSSLVVSIHVIFLLCLFFAFLHCPVLLPFPFVMLTLFTFLYYIVYCLSLSLFFVALTLIVVCLPAL